MIPVVAFRSEACPFGTRACFPASLRDAAGVIVRTGILERISLAHVIKGMESTGASSGFAGAVQAGTRFPSINNGCAVITMLPAILE